MAELRMREALRDAMAEEMRRDEAVFVMGEDVGVFQGAFKVTEGLLDEFGERRVRDTPISENTIVGAGVGAAMNGLRPIVELMTVNFSLLALDQIVNHAAAIPYMFNGQAKVPMVIRMPGGGGHQLGPTHSHSFEALYLQVPGLLVACPSTPADAKGLLKAAIRDDNPVIFIEHESLYGVKGEVRRGRGRAAALRRSGGAARGHRRDDRRAPEDGAGGHGGGAEAGRRARTSGGGDRPAHPAPARPRHDPRQSVHKTNRAVIVEEGWPHGGVGANLSTLITEQAFDHLDAPVAAGRPAPTSTCPTPGASSRRRSPTPSTWSAPCWRPSRGRSDGRDRDAAVVGLDGGGDDSDLDEVRRGRDRRGGRDRGDRDR